MSIHFDIPEDKMEDICATMGMMKAIYENPERSDWFDADDLAKDLAFDYWDEIADQLPEYLIEAYEESYRDNCANEGIEPDLEDDEE